MIQHLVLFARRPVMGAVKTRLARDIGRVRATQFYRQNFAETAHRLGNDPRWQLHIAVTPDSAGRWPGVPDSAAVIPQGRGDLGQRMDRVMQTLPREPVVIIGADIPDIQPRHINRAFQQIRRNDVAIGPAGDGGYWLIGMRRRPVVPRGAFDGVEWSSGMEMWQTLNNLTRWNRIWSTELQDVDDGDDWHRWRRRPRR